MSWLSRYLSMQNPNSNKPQRLITVGIALMILAIGQFGCTTQQLYNTGQAWQRNECNRLMDQQERSRCLSSTSTSYEAYKQQPGAGSEPK